MTDMSPLIESPNVVGLKRPRSDGGDDTELLLLAVITSSDLGRLRPTTFGDSINGDISVMLTFF